MSNTITDDIKNFIGAEECDKCGSVHFYMIYEHGYFVNIKDDMANGLNVIKRITCRKCKKEWVDEE